MYKTVTNVSSIDDNRNIQFEKLWIVISYTVVYNGEPIISPRPSITLINVNILPANIKLIWIL